MNTADWTDELNQLDGDSLSELADDLSPLWEDQPDLDDETQDKVKGLDADLAFRQHRRNTYLDCLQIQLARDHIQRLPDPGEAIHMVVSGRYPLFAVVPAVLELCAPCAIAELHLVTLSYGKDNAADLIDMLDRQQIGKAWLLVSHYFAHANPHLYGPLAAHLQSRGHRILAMRTHAKIILLKMPDGRKFVVHASANLRSCKNIEQVCFECDAALYDFHHQWVAGLFAKAAEVTGNEDKAKAAEPDHTNEGPTGSTETIEW